MHGNRSLNRRTMMKIAGLSVLAPLSVSACSAPSVSGSGKTGAMIQTDSSTPQRKWARDNLRGLLNLFLPSFHADLTTLYEGAIRADVRHAVAQGFSGTLPMINWTLPADPRWEQFHKIIIDEARGQLPVHGIVFGRDVKGDIEIIRRLEKLGVEMILLASTHDPEISGADLYQSLAARIQATDLPIMLYAALGRRRNFARLGPAGQPLDVYDRLADLPNTAAVKISQPVSLISTMQLSDRLADRLLIGPVNLDFAPLLSRHFPIQWSGQWNAEAIQTPDNQLGNQFINACAAQDFGAVDALALKLQPVLDQFFDLQASVIRSGAHPWAHNKYYSWIGGGNGGLLPTDPHAKKGTIPILTKGERAKIHAAFHASGLIPTASPEEQFIVGRTAWGRGVRKSDMSAHPYYQD